MQCFFYRIIAKSKQRVFNYTLLHVIFDQPCIYKLHYYTDRLIITIWFLPVIRIGGIAFTENSEYQLDLDDDVLFSANLKSAWLTDTQDPPTLTYPSFILSIYSCNLALPGKIISNSTHSMKYTERDIIKKTMLLLFYSNEFHENSNRPDVVYTRPLVPRSHFKCYCVD